MECLFKDVQFGEKVKLGLGYSTCRNCAADVQAVVESVDWIYCGHSADCDLFEPAIPIRCPSCKFPVAGYMQRCRESGSLEVKADSVFAPPVESHQ